MAQRHSHLQSSLVCKQSEWAEEDCDWPQALLSEFF